MFNKLLVELQDNMYGFALSLTADRDAAEDLTQETTLKILSNRDKYRSNDNFKAWVFTVMRNLFINNYHRLVRKRNMMDDTPELPYNTPQHDTAGMYNNPYHELSLQDINNAIETLNEELRETFSMYVSGYKYKEIADILELPIGTVKSRIFLARRQLRDILSDYY